ncbi:hypothetical protein MCUN1_000151 [Malassezia cuniculi]|uniref:Mitochondrial carrier protein n=1 Tax=Malassezia cuniculi TaxID=948313 RepID=A0AAF0EVD7_9BASI|nr:hypothetical protein MCUN1_000151 [Malassezia cuniculi]
MPVDEVDALALMGAWDAPTRIEERAKEETEAKTGHWRLDSFLSAVARTVIASMAFMFKRPIRIFRPVRFPTFAMIDFMAKQEGKKLGVRYLHRLVRRERPMFLLSLVMPPLLANTAIGFTLFQTYTTVERVLQHDTKPSRTMIPGAFTPLWVVASAGAAAGAAQCIISAPLENVRTVIQQYFVREITADARHARKARPMFPWGSISRAALMPFLPDAWYRKVAQEVARTHGATLGAGASVAPLVHSLTRRIHGAGLTLSVVRDGIGFSAFFVIFEITRRIALHTSLMLDSVHPSSPRKAHEPREWDQDLDVSYNTSRTVHGRLVAAIILMCGGAVGALIYELTGRPFELMRTVLHNCLHAIRRADKTKRGSAPAPTRGMSRIVRDKEPRASRIRRERLPAYDELIHFPRTRTRRRGPPTPMEPPRAFAQLSRYALRTTRPGEPADPLRLFVRTYLVRPYLHPERCPRTLARVWAPDYAPRHRQHGAPPVRAKRVSPNGFRWFVGRLLSPYGCAFLMFAWMGGDLA